MRIPAHTQELVLLEAGYMCGNPRCRHVLTLELHHMLWVRDGGGNEPSNLIALCPNCHALHTQGYIPAGAIRVWKGLLISLNSVNRANLDHRPGSVALAPALALVPTALAGVCLAARRRVSALGCSLAAGAALVGLLFYGVRRRGKKTVRGS